MRTRSIPYPSRRRFLSLAAVAALAGPARADALARVLVVGDSQAQGLAAGLQRLYRHDEHYRVIDRSRIGTGLIPRPRYDWPTAAPGIAAAEHADVTIVLFGANDRPPVWVKGEVDEGLNAAFHARYGAAVQAVLRAMQTPHTPVIWVGHPIVRDARFAADMALINTIFLQAAHDDGAIFLPTWDVFADERGAYTAYGRGIDGQTTRLRADDGVHLTAAGYDVVAKSLQPLIEAALAQTLPSRQASVP